MTSSNIDISRLKGTFSTEPLSWVWERVRQRLEQGRPLTGAVTLRSPTAQQRDAIARLLGRSPGNGTTLSIRLEEFESLLKHAEVCGTLIDAAEALLGPIVNLRLHRENIAILWDQLFNDFLLQSGSDASRIAWLQNVQATGLLRRLSGNEPESARVLLEEASRVLDTLPCEAIPLAELAASVLGNSHALDLGRPVATLVSRALNLNDDTETDCEAEARRDGWASVGVMLDELSGPVLILNLRADPDSLTGRSMNLHAAEGEPCRLSVRQLLRDPPRFGLEAAGRIVYVCENPTVVAAAANRLGPQSAPLICIEGQPKTAGRLLLNLLALAKLTLKYHGDFDWPGIQIANLIRRRHGAEPWRFDSASYRRFRGAKELDGQPVAAAWDAELMPTMVMIGRALDEEQMLGELLVDLGNGAVD